MCSLGALGAPRPALHGRPEGLDLLLSQSIVHTVHTVLGITPPQRPKELLLLEGDEEFTAGPGPRPGGGSSALLLRKLAAVLYRMHELRVQERLLLLGVQLLVQVVVVGKSVLLLVLLLRGWLLAVQVLLVRVRVLLQGRRRQLQRLRGGLRGQRGRPEQAARAKLAPALLPRPRGPRAPQRLLLQLLVLGVVVAI